MDAKQIVTTVTLFMLMSVSMTTEKVTLVWSLQILQQPDIDVITGYLILLIIIGGPYLFALLQILWNVPFIAESKDPQFPGIGNTLLGCFVCTVEAACLVFFAVEVAPIFPVYIFLPILNAILLISVLVEEVPKLQEQLVQKNGILGDTYWQYWKWFLMFVCMIACLLPSGLAVLLYGRAIITGNQALVLGTTLLGLSIVNCPVVQRHILAPEGQLGNKPKRITLFYTLLKITAIIFFFGIHFAYRVADRPDLVHILEEFTEGLPTLLRREIALPLSLNYLSAMISHGLSFTALSWCLPVYGILLPTVVSAAGAIALSCVFLEPALFSDHKTGEVIILSITSIVVLLIWCTPLLTTLCWTKKPDYLCMPFETLFMSYGWNAVFFDQYLLLSCRRDNSETESKSTVKPSVQTKSRIFVCTTMYREADYEMERLLMSLQGLSYSTKFNNVFLEAHIFMDNGCSGESLGAFAKQLVELINVKLGLSIQNSVCIEMPYGIQILWTLKGGMPLVVHLKDSQKVKAKKRWSQAMYVHYILNFRLKIPPLRKEDTWSDSSTSISVDIEQSSSNEMIADLSYKEIKRNSLVLGGFTENEKHAKQKGNRFKKWTNIGVESDRNIDRIISRTGYPTLVSHKRLPFDSQSKENEIQDQNASLQINGASFLESILIPADSALTETSDSALTQTSYSTLTQTSNSTQLSPMSSLTGSADDENDDADSGGNRVSSLKRPKLSYENEAFVGDDEQEFHINEKQISDGLENNFANAPRPDVPEFNARTLKTDEDGPHSSKRTNSNCAVLPQEMKIPKGRDGNGISPGDESTLRQSSLLSVHSLDTLCESENNPTNNFQRFEDISDGTISEDQIYILATDADMEFKDDAVIDLLDLCNNDKRVGAACGRTHPQGKKNGLIVWHQIFEYAKDFWMIKNAQNVIGSVMCCPGCFSLYRASAIRQIMGKFVTPTKTPFTVYVKDTGEDRWLATLMMVQGWYLRYSCFSQNNTFCPDTFEEFLKQRRRWVLSDIANAVLVVQNIWSLMRRNACFSLCYVLYLLNMFLNNIITPGTAIVMVTAGLDLVFGVPYLPTTVPLAAIVFVYSVLCTRTSTRMQTHMTSVLTVIMGSIFFAVVVWGSATIVRGIIQDILVGKFHFQQHYVIMLITLSFAYAALMHPRESYMVIYGLVYVFIFPAMHILLPIYSIANIIDQSWGTRDAQNAKLPKIPSIFRFVGRKKKKDCSKHSDPEEDETDSIIGELKRLKEIDVGCQNEYDFWSHLRKSILGTDVNTGLSKTELAKQLQRMRNRSLFGILAINGLWLVMLSVFYMGITSSLSRLNIYGVISGALYGFTLVIQMLGITACRLDHLISYLAKISFGHQQPFWIHRKE